VTATTTTDRTIGLSRALRAALAGGSSQLDRLVIPEVIGRRDRAATLLQIYALHTAPLTEIGDAVTHQHHPTIVHIKSRLEADWLAELNHAELPDGLPSGTVAAMRRLATRDRLPGVYTWLASAASRQELVDFLALEGGPDAGFDDLVALCQIGLTGGAKVELARNYWDEMGEGDVTATHTLLYQQMAAALDLPERSMEEQPVVGLERSALGGLLATNRWLQPEFLGALGMTELQAGPRCRLVLQAFERLGAPAAAYPFYRVHAEVDPRHGKDWLDNVIAPLAEDRPAWGDRMLRGALWRHRTNAAFFAAVDERTEAVAA
jgi:heme oxygenase-like protein